MKVVLSKAETVQKFPVFIKMEMSLVSKWRPFLLGVSNRYDYLRAVNAICFGQNTLEAYTPKLYVALVLK